MIDDPNKDYIGSGSGVAGNGPATPVSLSSKQAAAIQAAVASAFQQLQAQQPVADAQTLKDQLYELVREMSTSGQVLLDPRAVIERWQQTHRGGAQQPISRSVDGQAPAVETPSKPAEFTPTQTDARPIQPTIASAQEQSRAVGGVPEGVDSTTVQPDDGLTTAASADEAPAEGGSDASASVGEGEVVDSQASGAADDAGVSGQAMSSAGEPRESGPPPDNSSVGKAADTQAKPDALSENQKPENSTPGPDSEQSTGGQNKSSNDETAPVGPAPDSESAIPSKQLEAAGHAEHDGPTDARNQNTAAASQSRRDAGVPSSHETGTGGSSQEPSGQVGDSAPEKQGLPTGARDRFKRGFEDRKSGKGFKDAYSARKLPPGGTAAKGLGESAAKGAAENLAKEGAKEVAATAAKTAAKEGVKDTAKLASKTTPVGLLTDVDAKGAYKAAKDLKDFKVVSAAKGVTQSAAVTLFRVSYDPWVIGFTWGLSLIVTLVVGSVIFFMPSSSMTFLERLLVVALWILLLLIVLLVLGLTLISLCNGPAGWAVWAASWISDTAADINKFCEPIGALQAATKR